MDDEISRNTLLRYVADWQYSEAIIGNEAVYDTIEKFYHMVEEMPSVQPKSKREWYMCGYRDAQRWIPVTERLPENNEEVLTTYIVNGNKKKRYTETATYYDIDDGEWSSPWDEYRIAGTRIEVIAWMPQPDPYKEE